MANDIRHPVTLNHCRPSTFPAACPGCGRTLLGLLAALLARLPTVFAAVTVVVLVSLFPATVEAQGNAQEPCPGGGSEPVPTVVEVGAVPIVVESTTEEYFVLYVRHDLDTDTTVELPVLVKRGEAGTTTLAENVAALPKERYRVEKYLIVDPADVDGDCIDDITELADPVGMNPVNPAAAIALTDGAVAIPDEETFTALSAVFASRSGGWIRVVKFLLGDTDTDRPLVYFMNTSKHLSHQSFTDAVGLEFGGLTRGTLTYHPELVAPDGSQGLYYFSTKHLILPAFSHAERSYTQLAASMKLFDDNLAVYIPNYWLPRVQSDLQLFRASRMHLVFDDDISPETDFQALNPGEGYGRLRALEPDERPHPRDIVLYEALPNELPRVAGIISTVPQTPLSHVNLRAVQDRIPNAFIPNALDKTNITSLLDNFVRYEVTETGWELRATTKAEVDAHYASSRPPRAQIPQRDLSVTTITPLSEIGFADWTAFGVKAANVAVLGALGFPTGTVPGGFAIPFYFYDEFMKAHGFYDDIKEMLANEDFQTDFDTQDDMLDDLRDDIKDAETPQWIIDALTAMHATFPEGQSLRYRSSTNNEDLPRFNGAGLYDSKTQHSDEEPLSKSLKQVFASLWTFRAFTEREFHRIDHLAAKMGVLVHPNYSDELVNGVAASFDPFLGRDGSYYVNSQLGEDLVTNPDAHSAPEEILLSRDTVGYTILSFSNLVEPGELLMSGDQLDQLRRHLTVIHDHFKRLYNPTPGEPFAMEIEFKITSEDILAIKQARPWVFSAASQTTPPPPIVVTPLTVEMIGGTEPPVEGPFTVRFSFSEPVRGFTQAAIETAQDPACTDEQNNPVFCEPDIGRLETVDDRVFNTTVTPQTDRVAHNYTLTLTVSGGAVRSSVGNKLNEEAMLGGRVAPPGVTVPISEIGLTASGLDRAGRLNWNRPANDGGSPIIRYEYRYAPVGEVWNDWENVGAGAVGVTVGNLVNGLEYVFEVRAVNALGKGPVETAAATPVLRTGPPPPPPPPPPPGPRQTVPSAPRNLLADGEDGQVTLSWEAPEDDGGTAITDYEVRINGRGSWISIGSTHTTHTVTGLTNGTAYVFQVRAVNAAGSSPYSNRAEATPGVGALGFAHFANGAGIISDLVFVNVAPHPIRPALYFYDQEGHPIDPESVVDLTGDLEVTEDGALSIQMEMEPLGELTISTHGRGEVVSGSVQVVSDGPIGGVLRFDLPGIGVAGVGASQPVRDALFPARRQAGGVSTAAAVHNLGEEAMVVSCQLMKDGAVLEEEEIPLEANGQEARFIEEMFTLADMFDFVGLVRCTAPGRFTGIAVELDAGNRIFTTLPVVPVARTGGGGQEAGLDFAHFANGDGIISEMVFVNRFTQPSGPGPTPFHAVIPPSRPTLYFYDKEGHPIDPESVVDVTGDLEITEDGALTVRTEMEPLGELTISTHGQGELVSGSVRVVSDGPIGGVLRFDLPGIGVAGVGASQPVRDALFPARRQGGLSTAAAIHNPGEEVMGVRCRLMKAGVVLEEVEIPLAANGQQARYIEEMFTGTDTSDFVGSVRCTAPGEGAFTGVAVELDASNQIFTTLPVVPVER